jgi:uncharacterized membrane protein YphA (DoxX/SURF4 family)
MKLLTNISRVFVGGLFIFSGLIKANDPMGFGFKLEEYFEVFGTHFMIPLAMAMAILICVFEVLLGIMLLLGKMPKLVNRLLLAMIVFFTFLTFYSAYFDKVTDCGCFGDAIPLTPWQSFGKDIILLVFIVILIAGEKCIKPILSPKMTNYITIGGTALSLIFPLYTYRFLPVKDFRPYKIGADIEEGMVTIKQPVVEMLFIYEKDGERVELTTDELSTFENLGDYTFVERIDNIIDPGEPAPIHDFVFNDETGMDVTNVFLDQNGYKLLTVQYDLDRTDMAMQPELEKLAAALEEKGVKPYHVTAGTKEQIAALGSSLKYYVVDKTTLKTIVRSNPGLVLFKDNLIVMKWPSTRFPSVDKVMSYVD